MAKDASEITTKPNLQINVSEQIKSGVYSNLVVVTTTSNQEVMIDFIFTHPQNIDDKGNANGQVVSRVILPVKVAQEMKMVMESQLGKVKKE